MKILLLAVSLLAFVGCASKPWVHGVRFNDDGSIVNDSGRDLHKVTIEGEMWTHGRRVDVWPQKIGDWSAGETLSLQWRMESVDSFRLYGRCQEGRLYTAFPPSDVATDRPQTQTGQPISRPWTDSPYCQQCRSYHLPGHAHVGTSTPQ